jgi:hypothetical protein
MGRWAALLAVALVTVPTVLSLAVLPWVVWLAAELGRPWPAAVAAGLVTAIAAFLALSPANGYYRLRPFEASGAVYEWLGPRTALLKSSHRSTPAQQQSVAFGERGEGMGIAERATDRLAHSASNSSFGRTT